VEGTISDFHPKPAFGGGYDSFKVKDVPLFYLLMEGPFQCRPCLPWRSGNLEFPNDIPIQAAVIVVDIGYPDGKTFLDRSSVACGLVEARCRLIVRVSETA
jgi:hypothetical protein